MPANLVQMGHLLLYLITLKMKLILNSNKNSTSNSNHRKLRKRDRKLVLHYYLKVRHNNRNIPCHFFIQELICFQWTCTIASLIETDLRTQLGTHLGRQQFCRIYTLSRKWENWTDRKRSEYCFGLRFFRPVCFKEFAYYYRVIHKSSMRKKGEIAS